MNTETIGIIIAIISTFIAAPGPLFLKKVSLKKFSLRLLYDKNLYIAGLFYATSAAVTTIALKFGRLSVIGPTISLLYVWVPILSIKKFHEKIRIRTWIGIGIILAGIVLVNSGF
jgi:uncharacterized membrane protein